MTDVTSLGGNAYDVEVTATADGLVVATVPAGGVTDAAATSMTASTSTDNEISVDTEAPDVIIDRALLQADPTNNPVIHFTVTFTESVTGFGDSLTDATLSGSAAATVTNITGSGQDYDVEVTATGDGTVILAVPADVADDGAGNGNNASVHDNNIDDTVTYDHTAPTRSSTLVGGQLHQPDVGDVHVPLDRARQHAHLHAERRCPGQLHGK